MTFIARRVPAGNGCLTPEAVTGASRILEMTLGPEIAEEALNHMSWPDTFGIACRRAAAKANRRNDQRTLRARRLLDGEISLEALHQLGWIEGENIRVDVRWSAGDAALARIYAAQLIGLMPDVILASSTNNLKAITPALAPLVLDFWPCKGSHRS
jgi:hypothetical protein